jgi:hypothetical protein
MPRHRHPRGLRGIPACPSGGSREGRRGREALVRGARSPPESPEAGATRAFRRCFPKSTVCLGLPCKVINQSIVGLSPLSETTYSTGHEIPNDGS